MISLSASPSLLLLGYLPSEEEIGHAVYIFYFPFRKMVQNTIQLNLRPQRKIHVIINEICSRDPFDGLWDK